MSERIRPLIVEWMPGSRRIGDFTWPGLDDDAIVQLPIGLELAKRFRGFELGPVEMVAPEKPKRRTVALPYQGPPLRDLFVTATCPPDSERTTLNDDASVDGAEHFGSVWEAETATLTWHRVPRVPNHGVYVRERNLEGASIFKVEGFISIFCTDAVKRFVEDMKYTNVACLEVGEVD